MMAKNKDPAFLFYSADFIVGTIDLTMEERGQYITLICLQHQKGHLSQDTIMMTIGDVSPRVIEKFDTDEDGKYFNQRVDEEIAKREKYLTAQRENGAKGGRPKKPPDDTPTETRGFYLAKAKKKPSENENININTIKYIVSILNDKLGTKYKYSSEYIARLIKARLGEGFTPEDFEIVISKKLQEWKGTRFEKFLRPETLFGTKFQSYLNEIHTEQEPAVPKYSNASAEAALQEAMLRSYGG
jgi:uncharacterized phage protein (TIGR02220 family)